jgi:hypothetical protein
MWYIYSQNMIRFHDTLLILNSFTPIRRVLSSLYQCYLYNFTPVSLHMLNHKELIEFILIVVVIIITSRSHNLPHIIPLSGK